MPGMISAMPAVAVRRGRKKSKTFGRFSIPPSHHSSLSSISGRTGASFNRRGPSTITGDNRAFLRHRRRAYDSDLDRQRRRFLIYMGTLFLISGLLLVFVGVGAAVPTAQTVGLLLIGVGAVLCIIKVFCSEAHATEVPRKIAVVADADVESNHSGAAAANDEEGGEEGEPLAKIAEFTELAPENNAAAASPQGDGQQNSVTPTSPPNSIPETAVLIGNDSGGRY